MGDFFDDRLWEDEDWDADDDGNDGNDRDGEINMVVASHVVALIDCHPDMFQQDLYPKRNDNNSTTCSGESPFDASLFILETLMQHNMEDTVIRKTGKRNGVGVVLYNTKPIPPNSSSSSNMKNLNEKKKSGVSNDEKEDDDDNESDIEEVGEDDDDNDDEDDTKQDSPTQKDVPPQWMVQELMSLEPPGIQAVQTIQNFVRRKQDRNLQDDFAPSVSQSMLQEEINLTPLQSAIETAMRIFKSAKCVRESKPPSGGKNKKKTSEKDVCSIWIFTNRDTPYRNQQGIELVANVAREAISEMGINIVVWPLADKVHNHCIITTTTGTSLVVKSKMDTNDGMDIDTNNENDEDDENMTVQFDSEFYKSLLSDEFMFNTRLLDRLQLQDSLEELEVASRKNRKMYTTPFHILEERTTTIKKDDSVEEVVEDDDNTKKSSSSSTHTSSQPPIMVDWYGLTSQCRRPGKVKIDNETKLKVKRTRVWVDKDTEEEIAQFAAASTVEEKEQQKNMAVKKLVRKFYNFVNEAIPMEPTDTQEMKIMGCQLKNPGLIVLGFKPLDSIPSYHRLKQTFLIYPSDDDVTGSTVAFARLHAAMIRKKVVGIAQFWLRQSWEWRYCAIRPLPSQPDENGNGMLVIPLPFRDDLRTVEPDAASRELANRRKVGASPSSLASGLESKSAPTSSNLPSSSSTTVKQEQPLLIGEIGTIKNDDDEEEDDGSKGNIASEELVQATTSLMSKLDLTRQEIGLGDLILQNPAMINFHNYLSSIAFGIRHEKVENYLLRPSEEEQKEQMDNVRKEVEDIIGKLPADAEKPKASRKRAKDLVPDTSGLDWDDLLKTGKIKTCKVDQLKSYLRSVGEALTGRKDELVSRVTLHLQNLQKQQLQKKVKAEADQGTTMEV